VLVGDNFVGKTNLIFSYAEDMFIEEYYKTTSDEYSIKEMKFKSGMHER
jgi:GTPase SAR1 family protein